MSNSFHTHSVFDAAPIFRQAINKFRSKIIVCIAFVFLTLTLTNRQITDIHYSTGEFFTDSRPFIIVTAHVHVQQ